MDYDNLKLDNQLCFPVYAASRLIIREYQPYLKELGITYPQYLVLLVLWEKDNITVNEISSKLILNTNTTTPLLQRLEKLEIIHRIRSNEDERKMMIKLTEKGNQMKDQAISIPVNLSCKLMESTGMDIQDLKELKSMLHQLIDKIK